MEDNIQRTQKLDKVSIVSSLRLFPPDLTRMQIPLHRLIPMPMVRSTLICNLTQLENNFSTNYEDGMQVFYVSISNEEGKTSQFSNSEKEAWGPL